MSMIQPVAVRVLSAVIRRAKWPLVMLAIALTGSVAVTTGATEKVPSPPPARLGPRIGLSTGLPDPMKDWSLAVARVKAGTMTAEDAEKMVRLNLEDMQARRSKDSGAGMVHGSDGAVAVFHTKQLINDATLKAFVDGHLLGQIKFTPRTRTRKDEPLAATLVTSGSYVQWFTSKTLYLKSVVVEGKEQPPWERVITSAGQPLYGPMADSILPRKLDYVMQQHLPLGEHDVKFVFTVNALLHGLGEMGKDVASLGGEREFTTKITVVAPGEAVSEIGLSAAEERQVEEGIRPQRALVREGFSGRELVVRWWPCPEETPPFGYSVRPLVDGRAVAENVRLLASPAKYPAPGVNDFTFHLSTPLAAGAHRVDLELTPSSDDTLAAVPGNERIAGNRILIKDVPLNRFDLEGEALSRPSQDTAIPEWWASKLVEMNQKRTGNGSPESPDYWRALQSKVDDGSLTAGDVERAIKEFVQSVSREDRAYFASRTGWAELFVRKNLGKQIFSAASLQDFYAACFKWDGTLKTTVSVARNPNYPGGTGSTPYLLKVQCKPYWDGTGHPCSEAFWLEGVYRKDGSRVAVCSTVAPLSIGGREVTDGQRADLLSDTRDCDWELLQSLPAGEHELEFVFHVGAVPSDEEARGFTPYWGASRKWPAPGKLWEYRLKTKLAIPEWPKPKAR